ncbi:hypothetical protein H4219_000776 [Mycoemilia scoparia]|uniref:RRM domain-containing protein n=1 Tax=Mycoemilia scoparia TaxID=417184 RepID=A0A9W8A655_9FUNG|nr:hypothetical protein H4219_000776 [Mycoemilia scoparia]
MSSRLFLGNLPHDAEVRQIEREFKRFGEIVDVVLKANFGFIEFRDPRDAKDAMERLNDQDFMGKRLVIEQAKARPGPREGRDFRDRGPGPQRANYRISVDNISSSVRWQELKNIFSDVGDVAFADCHKIRQGQGIVEFRNEDDMRAAMRKLDGHEIAGRRIHLSEDTGPPRRRRSPSPRRDRYGGGRGRYNSRSRSPYRGGRGDRGDRYERRRYSRSPRRRRSRTPPPRRHGSRHDSPHGSRRRSSRSYSPAPPPPENRRDSPRKSRSPSPAGGQDVFNGGGGGDSPSPPKSPPQADATGWD